MSFGEELKRTTTMSNFMMVKGRSSCNAILGRPTLVALKAVTSIYQLCMKFPTLCGIGVIRGNQYEARMCYTMSVKSAPANPKGERTVGEAELAGEEAFTVGVPNIQYKLDPRGGGHRSLNSVHKVIIGTSLSP